MRSIIRVNNISSSRRPGNKRKATNLWASYFSERFPIWSSLSQSTMSFHLKPQVSLVENLSAMSVHRAGARVTFLPSLSSPYRFSPAFPQALNHCRCLNLWFHAAGKSVTHSTSLLEPPKVPKVEENALQVNIHCHFKCEYVCEQHGSMRQSFFYQHFSCYKFPRSKVILFYNLA